MSGPHQLSDGYLGDFCDGEIFKEHPIFSLDGSVIGYYDGVQIANPLGSRKHNIGKSISTSKMVNMHMCTQEQCTSLSQILIQL